MKWRIWALTAAVLLGQASARGQEKEADGSAPSPAPVRSAFPKATVLTPGEVEVEAGPAEKAEKKAGPVSGAIAEPVAGLCNAEPGCCAPGWSAYGGALYLHRSRPDHQTLLQSPPGVAVADASSLRFDWETGWEAGLRGRLNECWDVDLRYMQVDNFHARGGIGTAAIGFIPTNPPTTFAGPLPPTFAVDYDSELRSGELNFWRRRGDWLRFGIGFRWIQLNEHLRLPAAFPGIAAAPIATITSFSTRNDLYGIQLGGDARLFCRGRLDVTGVGKAGAYWVNARADAELEQPIGTMIGGASDSVNRVAFVGEAALIANYKLSKNVSLYGGYQALWLEGVALASDQLPTTGAIFAPTTNQATTNGGLFIHGAVLGVKVSW